MAHQQTASTGTSYNQEMEAPGMENQQQQQQQQQQQPEQEVGSKLKRSSETRHSSKKYTHRSQSSPSSLTTQKFGLRPTPSPPRLIIDHQTGDIIETYPSYNPYHQQPPPPLLGSAVGYIDPLGESPPNHHQPISIDYRALMAGAPPGPQGLMSVGARGASNDLAASGDNEDDYERRDHFDTTGGAGYGGAPGGRRLVSYRSGSPGGGGGGSVLPGGAYVPAMISSADRLHPILTRQQQNQLSDTNNTIAIVTSPTPTPERDIYSSQATSLTGASARYQGTDDDDDDDEDDDDNNNNNNSNNEKNNSNSKSKKKSKNLAPTRSPDRNIYGGPAKIRAKTTSSMRRRHRLAVATGALRARDPRRGARRRSPSPTIEDFKLYDIWYNLRILLILLVSSLSIYLVFTYLIEDCILYRPTHSYISVFISSLNLICVLVFTLFWYFTSVTRTLYSNLSSSAFIISIYSILTVVNLSICIVLFLINSCHFHKLVNTQSMALSLLPPAPLLPPSLPLIANIIDQEQQQQQQQQQEKQNLKLSSAHDEANGQQQHNNEIIINNQSPQSSPSSSLTSFADLSPLPQSTDYYSPSAAIRASRRAPYENDSSSSIRNMGQQMQIHENTAVSSDNHNPEHHHHIYHRDTPPGAGGGEPPLISPMETAFEYIRDQFNEFKRLFYRFLMKYDLKFIGALHAINSMCLMYCAMRVAVIRSHFCSPMPVYV